MKANLYDKSGKKKTQVDLPKIFSIRVREDLVQKYFEADKFIQPYASMNKAGLRQSASGTISHKRHDWKGHYGRGISRTPRKTMWRRGTQFMWVGANAPGTRGGRRSHPPKGIGKEKKINKKEIQLAFNSAFAATASKDFITKRYASIDKIESAPFIIETLPTKTKDLVTMIKTILPGLDKIAFKNKEVRAGKGKARGRKYKSNAGVLIIAAKDESKSLKGFDIISTDDVTISDLYPLGRLTIYTEKAIHELSKDPKSGEGKK
jgi:large subunit ribosomal protein L4e